MTSPEKRSYLAEAKERLMLADTLDSGLVPMWCLTDHLVALRDYYEKRLAYLESDQYAEDVAANILGGEAAAKDYEGDLL